MSTIGNKGGKNRLVEYTYIATQGQTTFSGPDAFGLPLTFRASPGMVRVSVNGRKLSRYSYAFVGSTGISTASPLNAGDVFEVEALFPYSAVDSYTISQANAFLLRGDADGAYATNIRTQFRKNLGGILPRSYIAGLILANNATDATNTLDINIGKARDSTDSVDLVLATLLSKNTSLAWAAGTGAGSLDTGSVANGTYHVFLIGNSTLTTFDILTSLSATAPTLPSGYTYFRRVGSIIRAAGAIMPFLQVNDDFFTGQNLEYNSTAGRTLSLLTLTVPSGIVVRPRFSINMQESSTGDVTINMAPGANAALLFYVIATNNTSDRNINFFEGPPSNLNSQINLGIIISNGSLAALYINTCGWVDRRGKDS